MALKEAQNAELAAYNEYLTRIFELEAGAQGKNENDLEYHDKQIEFFKNRAEEIINIEKISDEERTKLIEENNKRIEALESDREKVRIDSLSERLKSESMLLKEAQDAELAAYDDYLTARFEAESGSKKGDETQLEFLNRQVEYFENNAQEILKIQNITDDERIALAEELNKYLAELEKERLKEQENAQKEQIDKLKEYILESLNLVFDAINGFADVAIQEQQNWLDRQIEVEEETADTRIQKLKETAEEDLDNEKLTAEEKKAIKKQLSENIKAIETELNNSIAKLEEEAQNRAYSAAVMQKAIAHAEAGINSALAFTQALTDPSQPSAALKLVLAGTVLAAGIAQQVKIAKTPLNVPSAETGGRFIVPDIGAGRVDGVTMRVNPGEIVDVTPRSQTNGATTVQRIITMIDRQTIFDVVNYGIRNGDVIITTNNF
ncbi:MAG: hypothetical protein LBO67_03420 [Spirochaetaceae bacterium]|jgi:hypothetical protein|nr:hypothetical protein [Spirochaetaceae bacterium]